MRTLVDFLIEKRKREKKYFKNYLEWAKKIKKEAEMNLGDVKIILFGSIVKKQAGQGSDIDVLIISSELADPQERSKIRAKIFKKIGFDSPFELHLITPQEYKDWYSHFIKEKIEIK